MFEELQWVFDDYDVDHNGQIDFDEFVDIFEKYQFIPDESSKGPLTIENIEEKPSINIFNQINQVSNETDRNDAILVDQELLGASKKFTRERRASTMQPQMLRQISICSSVNTEMISTNFIQEPGLCM